MSAELDPIVHAPVRLRILVTLSAVPVGDTMTFSRLQDLLDLTAGNLITHLRKLEDAEYVASTKSGGTTTLVLTDAGRAAFAAYRRALAAVLDAAVLDAAG